MLHCDPFSFLQKFRQTVVLVHISATRIMEAHEFRGSVGKTRASGAKRLYGVQAYVCLAYLAKPLGCSLGFLEIWVI